MCNCFYCFERWSSTLDSGSQYYIHILLTYIQTYVPTNPFFNLVFTSQAKTSKNIWPQIFNDFVGFYYWNSSLETLLEGLFAQIHIELS